MPRQKDLTNNGVYIKQLQLVTPERALREHQLKVNEPVLVGEDSEYPEEHFYMNARDLVVASRFSPRNRMGIRFERSIVGVLSSSSEPAFRLLSRSWVAFLQPAGAVYTKGETSVTGYRIARAVRIERIEAHCALCARDQGINIPIDQDNLRDDPLKEGLAYDDFVGANGEGILRAACEVERHSKKNPWLEGALRYRFQISDQGEFSTRSLR